ncbi:hypothetical protein [Streptomyces sp. NPDC026673]|uniref:hypothetical protein n=1 Tax=Streptomyces sp. NPDC026673 TaxID=3155724 RepID=UPI0033D24005
MQLAEAFLVGHGSGGPAGGLVRFRISDDGEAGRSRRPSWRRTDLGRQLAGSGGELRLVHPYDGTGTRRALIPMLTLNGITDVAALGRLSVVGPFPSVAGRGSGHAATLGVDVRFLAGLWGLAVPEHTRCHVHLEGRVRVMPDWPMPR